MHLIISEAIVGTTVLPPELVFDKGNMPFSEPEQISDGFFLVAYSDSFSHRKILPLPSLLGPRDCRVDDCMISPALPGQIICF